MNAPSPSSSVKVTELIPKLLGLARWVGNLARRFRGGARFLTLSGALATLWLSFRLGHGYGAPLWASLGTASLLLVPVGLIGWCWWILEQACDLPERLRTWLEQTKSSAGDVVQRLSTPDASAKAPSRLIEWGKWGALVYELRSMGSDAQELMALFGGSIALTNPLVLVAIVASAGFILTLNCIALVTLVLAVWS